MTKSLEREILPGYRTETTNKGDAFASPLRIQPSGAVTEIISILIRIGKDFTAFRKQLWSRKEVHQA